MFLTPIRSSLRAGLLAGIALALCSGFGFSRGSAQALAGQDAHAAAAQSAAATTGPSGTPARAHIDEVLNGLNRGHGVGQVAVSPDGKRLAWLEGGRGGGEIRVAPLADL